jgi:hypothetical protein
VAAIAPDIDKLAELDELTRRAWSTYSESLRELRGEEYELIEHESWAELQAELQRLERQRRSLSRASA